MAKQGFAANTYNNARLGDVTQYSFVIVASTVSATKIDPNTAPPDTTVTTNGTGTYTITIPSSVSIVLSGLSVVGGAQTIGTLTVTPSTGVITFVLSGGADLSGSQQVHIDLYSMAP
jgi:hypothetical protein